jgi:hypothetical protein
MGLSENVICLHFWLFFGGKMMIHHWGAMFFWTLVTRRINNPFKKAIRATARPDLFGNLFGIHPWQEAEAWNMWLCRKKMPWGGSRILSHTFHAKPRGYEINTQMKYIYLCLVQGNHPMSVVLHLEVSCHPKCRCRERKASSGICRPGRPPLATSRTSWGRKFAIARINLWLYSPSCWWQLVAKPC